MAIKTKNIQWNKSYVLLKMFSKLIVMSYYKMFSGRHLCLPVYHQQLPTEKPCLRKPNKQKERKFLKFFQWNKSYVLL